MTNKLYKFSAEWCSGCKQLSNTLKSVGGLSVDLIEVDIDASPEIAKQYNIRSLPTLVLVDDMGKEVKRVIGNVTANKLQEFLK